MNEDDKKYAFLAGRFQPFHKGHFKTAKRLYDEAKDGKYEGLVVGIVNPDPRDTPKNVREEVDAFKIENNPFTYGQRYRMIHETLLDEGMDDHNAKQTAQVYAPHDLDNYVTQVAEGDWKIPEFEEMGVQFSTVPVQTDSEGEEYSGTDIRKSIREKDGRWEEKVHPEVEKLVEKWEI
jgi:nicotinamide mononucleotide adenylyltransferase